MLVDMVDGHGYDGQQDDTIYDVCGLWQMIQCTFKSVFCWFQLIGYAYELLREIFTTTQAWFTTTQRVKSAEMLFLMQSDSTLAKV